MALLWAVAAALPAGTAAEQASEPSSAFAGYLDVSGGAGDGSGHTCARVAVGDLRCWGFGGDGRLGYASTSTIGDDETPGAAGPVPLGIGRSAGAISAGAFHSCALLDDESVRCWGFGGEGRLGYGPGEESIGDDEAPSSAGPVNLGTGQTAKAITAGGGHTCAVLDDDTVRCWGFGGDGRLGYGNPDPPPDISGPDVSDPSTVGPVDLGEGLTAKAISAGSSHTCAVLSDDNVRCWGFGGDGRLGYGNQATIGNEMGETPGTVGPVDLGEGRRARAVSAGGGHTCALLDNESVRCWGFGGRGRLGYGNQESIGNDAGETPGTVGPVQLGQGARAISAGDNHTCALLLDGGVRCWGFGGDGRLGYANTQDVGDNEDPGDVGPVDLGPDRTAVAISAGGRHTCALLDDASIRCWGDAAMGRLGYCSTNDIGDNETPGSAGAVNVFGSSDCTPPAPPPAGGGGTPSAPPSVTYPPPSGGDSRADRYRRALAAQARRRRNLRICLRRASRRYPRPARRMRPRARRIALKRRAAARRRCLRRYGRTPGRVLRLTARGRSRTQIVLGFRAAGTDGRRPPAARRYLVKQSTRPIRSRRDFRRAQTLCRGRCGFDVLFVGAKLELAVKDLRPRRTYYFAVAARDNVSGRVGRRSATATAHTRR